MFARGFSLFNIAQVHNDPTPEVPQLAESERIARAEAFITALRVPIIIGGDMAYYHPSDRHLRTPAAVRAL